MVLSYKWGIAETYQSAKIKKLAGAHVTTGDLTDVEHSLQNNKKIENEPNYNGRIQNTGDRIQKKTLKTKPIRQSSAGSPKF